MAQPLITLPHSNNAEKLQSSYCSTRNSAPRNRQATFPQNTAQRPKRRHMGKIQCKRMGTTTRAWNRTRQTTGRKNKRNRNSLFCRKIANTKSANFICTIRQQKKETHQVRMTAGGDKLDYHDDASSPTVAILDAKIHINSTISNAKRGARYVCMDVQNFYLGTPMSYYQYIRVRRHQIWDDPRYYGPKI